jgi:hypothetical protein
VACLAVQHFSTLSHKRHDFLEKKMLNVKCVLILTAFLSDTFFILRRIERDMIKNVCWSSYKVAVIFVSIQ